MDTKPFFAVTYLNSTTVPGDERSRTHPGHGYPAHTVEVQELKTFKDEDEFKNWIFEEENKAYGKCAYTALHCTPIKVTKEIKVLIHKES